MLCSYEIAHEILAPMALRLQRPHSIFPKLWFTSYSIFFRLLLHHIQQTVSNTISICFTTELIISIFNYWNNNNQMYYMSVVLMCCGVSETRWRNTALQNLNKIKRIQCEQQINCGAHFRSAHWSAWRQQYFLHEWINRDAI